MAAYNNHKKHGWISLVINLVLIILLIIIVCCSHDRKTNSSWFSKKKLIFYFLLSLYGLSSAISLLLLFYHKHEDSHYGGDPLIQSVIWTYCGLYVEIILYYMATIKKTYCFCFNEKYSFIIMPILVIVITVIMVGVYAAIQTEAVFFICFVIFLLLTFYAIVHLFIMVHWNESINPFYMIHIAMVLVIIVYVGPLMAALYLCKHCLIFFVYGTNILSILSFVFIYDEQIEQLLRKLSKRKPIIAAGDDDGDDDGNELQFEKNEKQKNVQIIEDEDDEPKEDKPKKTQIEKPKVNIEPGED